MGTRFYFNQDAAAPVTPSSWSAGWNKTTGQDTITTPRSLSLGKIPSSFTGNGNTGTGVSGQFVAVTRFVSLGLTQAQTIGGTVKGQIACRETNATDNYNLAVAIKIVKSDGTDRGVLLAVSASDDVATQPPEMRNLGGGEQENRKLRDSAESTTITLVDVAAERGDFIVVEVGFRQDSTSTAAGVVSACSLSTVSDYPEDDTTTTSQTTWIEFNSYIAVAPELFNSSPPVPPDADATGVADAATSTLVPPTGMIRGDLAVVVAQVSNNSDSVTNANTGGQTWTKEHFTGANDQSVTYFWCTFNGTWSANPTFTCASLSGSQPYSVIMHVWRPPTTDMVWAVDQAFAGADKAAATTITITGQTTAAPNTVTLGTWCSNDDNTWSNLVGTGWASIDPAQQRNMAGADQSMTWARFISATAGTATGNVSKDMAGVGTDAGCVAIQTWKALRYIYPKSILVNQSICRSNCY